MSDLGYGWGWIVAAVVCLVLLRAVARRARRWAVDQLRRSGRRVPDLGPHGAVGIGLVLGVTALIARSPGWIGWDFVTGEDAETSPTTLLGAAAALLALLLFAANQLHGVQKDATDGGTYLGENIRAFGTSRSWTTRLFGGSGFHLAVVALFVLPLLLPVLPSEVATPAFLTVPAVTFTPRALVLALWCACFACVGTVLIGNALTTLFSAARALRTPWLVRFRIEQELRYRGAVADARAHLPTSRAAHVDATTWVTDCLRTAITLPAADQTTYLALTVGSPASSSRWSSTGRRVTTALERARRAPDEQARTGRRWGVRTWITVQAWWTAWRRCRALADLRHCRGVALARLRVLLEHLADPELTGETRQWVVDRCVAEAIAVDRLVARAAASPVDEAPGGPAGRAPAEEAAQEVRSILLTTEDQVVSVVSPLPHLWRDAGRSGDSPTVAEIPALVFRSLAELLSARERGRRVHLPETQMTELLRSAADLRHDPTRDLAVRAVVSASITALVVDRHDGALAGKETVERFATYAPRPEVAEAVHDGAFRALQVPGLPGPAATARLLPLVRGWRRPALVLYHLLYGHRSGRPLPATALGPFARVWWDHGSADPADDPDVVAACVDFLVSRWDIGHFVSPEGLTWLLESLGDPFTLELCATLLEHRRRGTILDFGLRDFLLWRLTMHQVRGRHDAGRLAGVPDDDLARIGKALPDLRALVDEWAAIDAETAREAGYTLFRFGLRFPEAGGAG